MIKLSLDEVRRLTGPNLLSDYTGAIIDVFIEGIGQRAVVDCWRKHLNICQEQIGWTEKSFVRFYEGGASMSLSAPIDQLYSACDLIEIAWDCCVAELQDGFSLDIDEKIDALSTTISEEKNPALMHFIQVASEKGVRCLVDDDEVSLGSGLSSQTFTVNNLPNTDSVLWHSFKDIPIALITGTNGKSTSVRLAAKIAKAEGLRAGVTSTDFIKVADHIIDEGDYSGPGGARMLLRNNTTEIAFLEVARGGLLRRGLPVYSANAALVTNVASDHLGQYGINTVDEIAEVKLMVAKAIHAGNILVLNADNERLVRFSEGLQAPICWFSRNILNAKIQQHLTENKPCVYQDEAYICYAEGTKNVCKIAKVDEIPMTVKGTALHNVENALGVVGLCKAMHISDKAITAGLLGFASNAQDNPGRTNIYEVKGNTVVVDFAHNAHSMQAVIEMAKGLQSARGCNNTHVLFSHAGDRSDADMKAVADAVYRLQPSSYVLAELEDYLRGRKVGEISDIVEAHLLSKGVAPDAIVRESSPLTGAKAALARAGTNDLVLLFTLSEREQVQALIDQLTQS